MKLDEFLTLQNEFSITFEESQILNKDLSKKSISDIPEKYHSRVADHLVLVLNMQSVEPQFVTALDELLKDLQKRA